ncbi:MAG: homoserine O-acetyltransferase [Myxococcales bacterium]|nr:homoserine O-acetyltransferase [Myxococcales bacterium]
MNAENLRLLPPRRRWSPGAAHFVQLEGPFGMRQGGSLAAVELAYETWGTLSPTRDNVLLLCTGLSPRAHARSSADDPSPGWWEAMIGPGQAIDTDRYFVICFNNLGGCFGSTGPASFDPATGAPYRLSFPVLTIEDVAAAFKQGLADLGITRLAAVVGPSLGGMTALAIALSLPVERLAVISSAARALPFAIAIHSLQREAIRSDPGWQGGYYDDRSLPATGMRLARKIGMLSYRSAEEWRGRFGRERLAGWGGEAFGPEFEVEGYLEHHASKFVDAFDANCYLYLSRAMDLFDLAEHGGSLEKAAARITAKTALVIGVTTDILFPVDQQRCLADVLRSTGRPVEYAELTSVQGHDAFLVDIEAFAPLLSDFLSRPLA